MLRRKDKAPKVEFGKSTGYDQSEFLKKLKQTQDSGGAMIELYERKTAGQPGKGSYVDSIPGQEALTYASYDGFLKERYGDGIYNSIIMDSKSEYVWQYTAHIGNAKLQKEKSGDKEKKSADKTSLADMAAVLTAVVSPVYQVLTAMISQMGSKNNDFDFAKYIEVLQNAQSQAFTNALQLASVGADPLESAERLISISKAIQPAIQPEDSMTSLINAIPALAGLAVNLKGQQQPMGQLQQALPPGQTQAQLTPQQLQQVQAYIQQLQTGQTQAPLAGTQPQAQTPAQDISKSSNEEHRQFYYMYIDKIRRAVTGGESDYDIAKKIIDMMEYSVDYMRNDPHPLVAGMVTNMDNAVGLHEELYKFFDAIPELAGHKQKQDSIQANIIEIYTGGPPDDADNADLGGQQVGDADQQDGKADSGESKEPDDDQGQLP